MLLTLNRHTALSFSRNIEYFCIGVCSVYFIFKTLDLVHGREQDTVSYSPRSRPSLKSGSIQHHVSSSPLYPATCPKNRCQELGGIFTGTSGLTQFTLIKSKLVSPPHAHDMPLSTPHISNASGKSEQYRTPRSHLEFIPLWQYMM